MKRRWQLVSIEYLPHCRSPGHTLLPQTFGSPGGDGAVSGLSEQYQHANMTFMQSPQGTFVPSEFKGNNGQYRAGSASGSQQDIQVKLIERQIEVVPLDHMLQTAPLFSFSSYRNVLHL